MSKKNATPATKKIDTRDALAAELERIRVARETEEKTFREALEKLYADHRKAMKQLAADRTTAWEKYNTARKATKDAPAKPIRKAAKKAAAPTAEEAAPADAE